MIRWPPGGLIERVATLSELLREFDRIDSDGPVLPVIRLRSMLFESIVGSSMWQASHATFNESLEDPSYAELRRSGTSLLMSGEWLRDSGRNPLPIVTTHEWISYDNFTVHGPSDTGVIRADTIDGTVQFYPGADPLTLAFGSVTRLVYILREHRVTCVRLRTVITIAGNRHAVTVNMPIDELDALGETEYAAARGTRSTPTHAQETEQEIRNTAQLRQVRADLTQARDQNVELMERLRRMEMGVNIVHEVGEDNRELIDARQEAVRAADEARAARNALNKMQTHLEQLRRERAEIGDVPTIVVAQREAARAVDEARAARNALNEMQTQLADARRATTQATEEGRLLRANMTQLRADNDRLRRENQASGAGGSNGNAHGTVVAVELLHAENADLHRQFHAAETRVRHLERDLAACNRDATSLDEENDAMQTRIDSLVAELATAIETGIEVPRLNAKIVTLERDAATHASAIETTIAECDRKLQSSRAETEAVVARETRLRAINAGLEEQIRVSTHKVDGATSDSERRNRQLEKALKDVKDLETELAETREKMSRMARDTDNAASASATTAAAEIRKAINEIRRLEGVIAARDDGVNDTENALRTAEGLQVALQSQLATTFGQLKDVRIQLTTSEMQRQELAGELEESDRTIGLARASAEHAGSTNVVLQARLVAYETTNNERIANIANLHTTINGLERDINGLREKNLLLAGAGVEDATRLSTIDAQLAQQTRDHLRDIAELRDAHEECKRYAHTQKVLADQRLDRVKELMRKVGVFEKRAEAAKEIQVRRGGSKKQAAARASDVLADVQSELAAATHENRQHSVEMADVHNSVEQLQLALSEASRERDTSVGRADRLTSELDRAHTELDGANEWIVSATRRIKELETHQSLYDEERQQLLNKVSRLETDEVVADMANADLQEDHDRMTLHLTTLLANMRSYVTSIFRATLRPADKNVLVGYVWDDVLHPQLLSLVTWMLEGMRDEPGELVSFDNISPWPFLPSRTKREVYGIRDRLLALKSHDEQRIEGGIVLDELESDVKSAEDSDKRARDDSPADTLLRSKPRTE